LSLSQFYIIYIITKP